MRRCVTHKGPSGAFVTYCNISCFVLFSEMPQSNNKIPVKITDQFQDIDPWHLEIQIGLATQTNSNNLAAKVT